MDDVNGPKANPNYGGRDEPHPHHDPAANPSYGGENAPHAQGHERATANPNYGGADSPRFQRTIHDTDETVSEAESHQADPDYGQMVPEKQEFVADEHPKPEDN